ncbi:MAG: Hsp70 family protein [Pedosphaera sp.]|nr:Hsp70 family protein [Pedosphaera sp.]
MSKIVGIDLGTTHSAIAVVEAGMPGILADAEGRRLLPSVVHFPANGEPVVGVAAKRIQTVEPERTVSSAKRFMGRFENSLVKGEAASPVEVSALILKELRAQAEVALGESVDRAVITVPAYFNDAQRQATKLAGKKAGWKVERIINEPTAAALACGLQGSPEGDQVAVYDLGGGTFDLSILELREGVFQVLATHGNTALGGDDVDAAIAEWLETKVEGELDAIGKARIREAAEQAKIALSSSDEYRIQLPFLKPDFSLEVNFSRADLESLARPILEQTKTHCRQALADAGMEAAGLSQVILVGGQTRMPLVRRLVAEWFECAEYEEVRGDVRLGDSFHAADGAVLNTGVNPDEAVALGASIQGAILSGEMTSTLLLDVTPLSLGVETFGGLMNVIIPRNSTIPAKAGEMFTNAVDGQRAMLVHVLQGERERAADNWSLGRFELEFESAPRGGARVGVQFEIDADGILQVLARDTITGREKIVPIQSAVDVSDDRVQEMVEESVEYAFEDMDARRWVEAALKAGEAVKAARDGLEAFRDELDNAQIIDEAIAAVEGLLQSADNDQGDLPALKAAVARLDQVTLPLADLIMDRAMEAMLRKQGVLD